jgi:tol-pal system protein YbgF
MKTSFRSTLARLGLAASVACCFVPLQANAGLFDDDEARRAILDIRARIDAVNARVDSKADKALAIDSANQNEQLRAEIARLRGQIEVLTNELANEQRRQKDFYTDLDNRLRKMEPQKATVDGREVSIEPGEQKAYEASLAAFKSGDYKAAASAFSGFLQRYPQSGYAGSAYYWLGNAQYAMRDYRGAIPTLQNVARTYADNPKAPDALLTISSCYTELKDKSSARRTLDALVAQYPDSDAAKTARERIASLR